jgi:hypothetical protein
VRLILKDSERRPDPAPVKTDDRKAMLVGVVLWLIALGVALIVVPPLADVRAELVIWTCVIGIALGLILLIYTQRRSSHH